MPRPSRCRRVCAEPAYDRFVPEGIPCGGCTVLGLDEYETIRLIDLEQLSQSECAARMDISRTTVAEVYGAARRKIADCLVNGRPLRIEGGNYRLCDGMAAGCPGGRCPDSSPGNQTVMTKGSRIMRIAVTHENGSIFQHFGHSSEFKVYDTADGQITASQVVSTNGSGHGALATLLQDLKVDALICGGIGGGAQTALAQAGIRLYGGVSGDADDAVRALLAGSLDYQASPQCSGHGHAHGHSCGSGEHHCGEDHQGCAGNGCH